MNSYMSIVILPTVSKLLHGERCPCDYLRKQINILSPHQCGFRTEHFTPCKGIQDSFEFWVLRCGFLILCQWNLDSGF